MTEATRIPGQLWRGGFWSENGRLDWQPATNFNLIRLTSSASGPER